MRSVGVEIESRGYPGKESSLSRMAVVKVSVPDAHGNVVFEFSEHWIIVLESTDTESFITSC